MRRSRWTGQVLAAAGAAVLVCGCPKSEREGAGVTSTQPAGSETRSATTAPVEAVGPADANPENRIEIRLLSLDEQQEGWLRIEAIREGARGAWASGANPKSNRILIEMENVDQFSINCALLRIDWSKRVVLRIDGRSSELKRKRRPVIHFRRSPAGSWDVVKASSE